MHGFESVVGPVKVRHSHVLVQIKQKRVVKSLIKLIQGKREFEFEFFFLTLLWGFLFMLFGLLSLNYLKLHKTKGEKHFYTRKVYTLVNF